MAEAKIKVDRFCMLQQKKNHLRRDGKQNHNIVFMAPISNDNELIEILIQKE